MTREEILKMRRSKTVVFDFDGVINSYKHGFTGIDYIPDPPVRGIKNEIEKIREDYLVVVVSTRCKTMEGKNAVKKYLDKYGIIVDGIMAEKPPAVCYIDDRAICFNGVSKGLADEVKAFQSWTEKEEAKKRCRKSGCVHFPICEYVKENIPTFNFPQEPNFCDMFLQNTKQNPVRDKKRSNIMETKLSTIQKRNNLNEVVRADEPGAGGACHVYMIQRRVFPVGEPEQVIPVAQIQFKEEGSTTGVLDCDLLEIVRDRLRDFQKGKYANMENAHAITHIEEALLWMSKRAEDRAESERCKNNV